MSGMNAKLIEVWYEEDSMLMRKHSRNILEWKVHVLRLRFHALRRHKAWLVD